MGAWAVGVSCTDVGNFLHFGGSGGDPLRFGVMGHVPTDWEDAGNISPLVDTAADGMYATYERV